MRVSFFLGIVIVLLGCNHTPGDNKIPPATVPITPIICTNNYDGLLLQYANNFNATTVTLDESLSPQLDSFLIHTDTNCLRKQKKYKTFIATILAKLCLHHLKCCNQGYDLLSMEDSGAKIIVEDFRNMSGYGSNHLDMLNSEFIIDFIEKDTILMKNSIVKGLLKKIYKEADRINNGNI